MWLARYLGQSALYLIISLTFLLIFKRRNIYTYKVTHKTVKVKILSE